MAEAETRDGVSLTNLDEQNIRLFLNAPVTSPKIR